MYHMCHMSHVTCHMSLTPTATATATDPSLVTPPLCTVGWFANTPSEQFYFKTQFEIECRFGGHTVTKKFKTILQILLAKPKLWKNLYFYK